MINYGQHLPKYEDHVGASRAILKIYYAYKFNLTELSEDGKISYINSDGRKTEFSCHEKMHPADYFEIAKLAMDQKLHNLAIDFTKEVCR